MSSRVKQANHYSMQLKLFRNDTEMTKIEKETKQMIYTIARNYRNSIWEKCNWKCYVVHSKEKIRRKGQDELEI